MSDDIISVSWPWGRYNFLWSSLEDVLEVGNQNGTCFAGTSGLFCWPYFGCNEVNRLFVSWIYHNCTGQGQTPSLALDKVCTMSIVKIPKYGHCFHHCSGYQEAVCGRAQCYGCALGIDNDTPKNIISLQSFIGIDTVILHTGKTYFSSSILRLCNKVI